MRGLFDTSVVLDYLRGVPPADAAIEQCRHRAITVPAWLQVLTVSPAELEQATRYFLQSFQRIQITEVIADRAMWLMKQYPRLQLRHAVPWAAAQANSLVFVTADFPNLRVKDSSLSVPYRTRTPIRQMSRRGLLS